MNAVEIKYLPKTKIGVKIDNQELEDFYSALTDIMVNYYLTNRVTIRETLDYKRIIMGDLCIYGFSKKNKPFKFNMVVDIRNCLKVCYVEIKSINHDFDLHLINQMRNIDGITEQQSEFLMGTGKDYLIETVFESRNDQTHLELIKVLRDYLLTFEK